MTVDGLAWWAGRLCVVLTLVVLGACSPGADDMTPAPTVTSTSTPSASAAAERRDSVVVAISIDGLNPDAITSLGGEGLPNLSRLIDEGASTLNARTSYERTTTLPNHTGMLTGRPVAGDDGTSVTFNDDNGSTLTRAHDAYVPGMFDIAHDAGVKTALFAEKDKFRFLVRSWDKNHGAADVTGADDGRDKIDLAAIEPANKLVGEVTAAVTRQDARLVFWHIAAPDAAGHGNGWLSPAYLAAVQDADDKVGRLLAALDADPDLEARTTILLTADHGGAKGAFGHGDAAAVADYRIPFVAWGRGVAKGADLYDLNPDLGDPGNDRPDYTGAQPIRNLDLPDTALALLGLPDLSTASQPVRTGP